MPYYEDKRHCRECNRMETSRAECPDCPCSYCHGNHPKINCPNPRVKPCEMCGTKAHETKYCLIKPATPDSIKAQFERLAKMKSERLAKARLRAKAGLGPSRKDDRPWPIARLGPSRMNARPRANAGLRPSRMNARDQGDEHFRSFVANGRTYNVSVVGPRHDHPMWSAIPKIVREDVTVQETFIFPQLRYLCVNMLIDILNNLVIESQDFNYAGVIEAHGIQDLTTTLLSYVRPEIEELEGQPITRERLLRIQQAETQPWTNPMGYLDFITDSRDPKWLRFYVGQTVDPRRRIINQHTQEIKRKSTCTLHYYIVWLGNGKRTTNFIRLWDMPNIAHKPNDNLEEMKRKEELKTIKMNLLEALFCKAFSSHHGILDRLVSSDDPYPPRTQSYGLNLMTPLAQNGVKPDGKRSSIVAAAKESPDTQILYWVDVFRGLQAQVRTAKSTRQLTARRPVFKYDYDRALQSALNESLFQTVKKSLISVSRETYHAENDVESIPYFGSLSAKIGFVLDFGALSEYGEPHTESLEHSNKINLPWSLEGCQFNKENVLLWTFNFQGFRPLGADGLSDTPRSDPRHRALINRSQARIIFMCGLNAEKAIITTSLPHYTLELRGFRYHMYVDNQCLFLALPALPSRIWSNYGTDSSRISEALRFAISMLGLKEIRPYSVETSSIIGTIISWARRERQGEKPMTIELIPLFVKLWLARKGLDETKLRAISEMAGSVSQGMLMILHSLPRNPGKRPVAPADSTQQLRGEKKNRHISKPFDMDTYRVVNGVVKDAIKVKERGYGESLQNLPQRSVAEKDDTEILDMLTSTDSLPRETFLEVCSSISEERSRQDQSSTTELGLDDELDIHILDAAPLCRKAIEEGYLGPEDSEVSRTKKKRKGQEGYVRPENSEVSHTRKKRKGQEGYPRPETPEVLQSKEKRKGQVWLNQVEVYKHKEYPYRLSSNEKVSRQIVVNSCAIRFKAGEDVGNGEIRVGIQLSPPGKEHPHYYATEALDTDPARRLAFLIRYQPYSGPEVQKFVEQKGFKHVCTANAFVDKLSDKKTAEEIAKLPRRWLFLTKESAGGPELERFIGGDYTSKSVL